MVQGIDLIQMDVAFLTYNPDRPITKPEVKLDSLCTAGSYELRKHRELKRKEKYEMGSEAYQHYKWYNSILRSELEQHGDQRTKLKIYHWHIESSNVQAFTMDEVLYKAVSVIISPTLEYWYCANAGRGTPHIWGSRPRPLIAEVVEEKSSSPTTTVSGISLSLTSPCGGRQRVLIDHESPDELKSQDQTQSHSRSENIGGVIRRPQNSTTRGNSQRHRSSSRVESVAAEKLCTPEFCANNCEECKGREIPTTIPRQPRCACYISKKNGKYRDRDGSVQHARSSQCLSRSSPSCVSISEAIAVLNEKKSVLLRGCEGPTLRRSH